MGVKVETEISAPEVNVNTTLRANPENMEGHIGVNVGASLITETKSVKYETDNYIVRVKGGASISLGAGAEVKVTGTKASAGASAGVLTGEIEIERKKMTTDPPKTKPGDSFFKRTQNSLRNFFGRKKSDNIEDYLD